MKNNRYMSITLLYTQNSHISVINCAYLVIQLCLTLCDSLGCSLPGPSVHGIFQARVLEWAAISFSTEDAST